MADTGPVLVKEPIPISSKDTETILMVVKHALSQPGLVKFTVDARKNFIDFWRVASEEAAAELGVSFGEALSRVDMEEYDPYDTDKVGEKTSFQQVFEMFEMIEDAGCLPSHVLSGCSPLDLRKWLPLSRKSKSVCGVPLHFVGELEHDVLIVCGSKEVDATASDIQYAVKVTLP